MMSPVNELQSLYRVLLEGSVAMTTFKIVVVLSMYELIFACIMRRKNIHSSRRLLNSNKKMFNKKFTFIFTKSFKVKGGFL